MEPLCTVIGARIDIYSTEVRGEVDGLKKVSRSFNVYCNSIVEQQLWSTSNDMIPCGLRYEDVVCLCLCTNKLVK